MHILADFGAPSKCKLLKISLNEACSKVRTDNHMTDNLSIEIGMKQEDILKPLLLKFVCKITLVRSTKTRMD
jgi:hypothetical protein